MKKLREILQELEKPASVYAPGQTTASKDDEDIAKLPFRMKNTETDPETGKSTSTVEYLPEFDKIKIELIKFRKEFQQFKYSTNPDISQLSTKINGALTKIVNAVQALDQMVKREQRKNS